MSASLSRPTALEAARTLATVLVLLLILVTAAPAGILLSILFSSARPLFATAFPSLRLLIGAAGVRLRVSGRDRLEPDQAYVFVCNHQSNADPPIAFLVIHRTLAVLAKASLFKLPVLGTVFTRAGFVPVHRRDRERAIGAVERAAAGLRGGTDFLVFPEGTRSPDGRLLPFKKGPFVMAIEAGVPVAPIVIAGTREIQPKGSWVIRPGRVDVTFLDPIPTAGLQYEDRDQLLRRVRAAMSAVVDKTLETAIATAGKTASEPGHETASPDRRPDNA